MSERENIYIYIYRERERERERDRQRERERDRERERCVNKFGINGGTKLIDHYNLRMVKLVVTS